jgi:ankyrin repeat protein
MKESKRNSILGFLKVKMGGYWRIDQSGFRRKSKFIPLLFLIIFTINCSTFETQNNNRNIADLAYSGDIYNISNELSKGRFIDEKDSFQKKYTALMVASREGDFRLAEWLIERGANVNAKTPDGHTALMYASYNRFPEIVRLLISRGARVNLKSIQGHTALSEVLESDKKVIIEMLQNASSMEDK